MNHSAAHSALVNKILLRIGSRPDVRLWRANTGVGRPLRSARIVRFGIKGQADITGILKGSGRRIEIEVKTGTGEPTPEQIAYRRIIETFNGLYVLARNVEDVEAALGRVTL